MANDFTCDPHCVALYRFESGALTVDSKDGNTLTAYNNPIADTVDFREGAASVQLVKASSQYFARTDPDLNSGFPCKFGETNRSFTFCFWILPGAISSNAYIISKSADGGGAAYKQSYRIYLSADTKKITLLLVKDGTYSGSVFTHNSELTCDGAHWYHVAVSHDASNGGIRIRIWDDTAQAILGTDRTDTFAYTLNVGDADFCIGKLITYYVDGNLDEVVVFNRVLSTDVIDLIRQGKYFFTTAVVDNAFTLLYDIAVPASGCTCDNESINFPLENAIEDYHRPFKRFHSEDTTETIIELSYESAINTIFLGNCNFVDFKIEIFDIQHELETVEDKDTGLYNACVRILPLTGITKFKIIIPAQATINGEEFFAIGSIIAGIRSELTAKPQYALRKHLVEPVHELRFDLQNREVQRIGRPYHLLEFNWNAISNTDFTEIEDAIREVGQDGLCVLHEKWSDYEASYLCQLHSDFSFSRIRDFYQHPLSFRECM